MRTPLSCLLAGFLAILSVFGADLPARTPTALPDLEAELDRALASDPPPRRSPTVERLATLPGTKPLAGNRWFLRRYTTEEELTLLRPRDRAPEKLRHVALPVALDDDRDFFCQPGESLWGWDELAFTFQVPEAFPANADIFFFVKDWDDLWLHVQRPLPAGAPGTTVTMRVPLAGEAARQAWTPRGHFRPWHQTMPDQVAEVGIKVAMPKGVVSDYHGELVLEEVSLSRDPAAPPPATRITDLQQQPLRPRAGQPIEVSFRVDNRFLKPFDRADVELMAEVVSPAGDTAQVRLFYYEDFTYDVAKVRGRILVPAGDPRFCLRYTPVEPGDYTAAVSGTIGGQAISLPMLSWTVLPAAKPWPGFVRVSPEDNRLLSFSRDGGEFWGIGINVRSPYDTRYVDSFPFTTWDYDDFDIYEKLLPKYAAAGIDVVEVWMSPWWLALEWMPDAPGNHGVGHMNQWRAWKIDRLLQLAEELDIYVILVINNHGKFSAWIDSDWDRSPFNVKRGGKLETPMQYFSDPGAREDFKRLADYMVARWGYSPRLLAWKLFTEIDLTGDSRQWYKDPSVRDWHRFAGAYFKSIDPNQHLVTTHWATSYQMVNPELAKIPELDMLTLDIYYNGTGAEHLYEFMFSTAAFANSMEKPAIITEFGGSPHGDTLPHILHQLHLGLWAGFFNPYPVTPCFWWFPLVEERDLYHEYANLARFTLGEKRTGATFSRQHLGGGLAVCQIENGANRFFWVVDTRHYFGGSLTVAPSEQREVKLALTGLAPGDYRVEFWDCQTGRVVSHRPIAIAANERRPTIELPAFRRDLAVKVKPLPATAPTAMPPSDGTEP